MLKQTSVKSDNGRRIVIVTLILLESETDKYLTVPNDYWEFLISENKQALTNKYILENETQASQINQYVKTMRKLAQLLVLGGLIMLFVDYGLVGCFMTAGAIALNFLNVPFTSLRDESKQCIINYEKKTSAQASDNICADDCENWTEITKQLYAIQQKYNTRNEQMNAKVEIGKDCDAPEFTLDDIVKDVKASISEDFLHDQEPAILEFVPPDEVVTLPNVAVEVKTEDEHPQTNPFAPRNKRRKKPTKASASASTSVVDSCAQTDIVESNSDDDIIIAGEPIVEASQKKCNGEPKDVLFVPVVSAQK
ncbi:MAG: hypothetical protein RR415_06540 [Ruthenibacterium sp.]